MFYSENFICPRTAYRLWRASLIDGCHSCSICMLVITGETKKTTSGLIERHGPQTYYKFYDLISLSSVCSLTSFPMLETLDVKSNLISGKF